MTTDCSLFVRRARHEWWLIVFLIAGLGGLAGRVHAAQSVELTWTNSTSPHIANYDVYFGTQSGVYPNSVTFGVVSNVIVPGLADGTTYYFAVTAIDTNGNQSAYSTEAVYTTPGSPPITLHVQASTQALGAVEVYWTASADSDVYGYAVNYWTQGSGYTNTDQFYQTTNGIISGLVSGTTYYFTIAPIDSYGIESFSTVPVSFTVPNPVPLVLHAQLAVGTSGVDLTWNNITNEGIVSYNIYYGTQSQNYTQSQSCDDVTNFVVYGLNAGQVYYFVVAPVDDYGDQGPNSDEASSVAAGPVPIKNLKAQASTGAIGAVEISWTGSTDPDVYGYNVYYWISGSGYTNSDQFYDVTNGIIPGLDSGTNYYFAVAPIDAFGVEAIASSNVSYTVSNATPLVVHAQLPVDTSGVELTWNNITNEGIVSYNIYYGTQSQNYTQSQSCDDVTNFVVYGLDAGQVYYFVVAPVDGYGDQGPYSAEVSSVAEGPVPIKIQAQGSTAAIEAVQISWTPSTDSDVDGYNVYYWTQASGYTNSDQFYGVTNGIISDLPPGTNYFAVAPVDSFGVEAIASSNVVYKVQALPAIMLHAKVQTTLGAVELSWNTITNEGITGYNVYYGTQSGSYSYSQGYGITNDVLVQGLNAGQTYYFAVNAQDAYGNQTPYSNEASAVAPNPARMLLTTQIYTDGNGQPYLVEINTPTAVFGNWEVDYSTDLKNWTQYQTGYGSGTGDGYDVDVYVPVDPTQQQVFFRAINY